MRRTTIACLTLAILAASCSTDPPDDVGRALVAMGLALELHHNEPNTYIADPALLMDQYEERLAAFDKPGPAPAGTVRVASADTNRYCIEYETPDGEVWSTDKSDGLIVQEPCA